MEKHKFLDITTLNQNKYNNIKLDDGGWTDRDIVCIYNDIELWRSLTLQEKKFVRKRYNQLIIK